MTTGRRPPGDKETWWWNDKVQEVIHQELSDKGRSTCSFKGPG